MSALDQAIIKAYAKDGRATVPPEGATGVLPVSAQGPDSPVTPQVRAHAIEQIYHDGRLYRIESQPVAARREQSIPAPHLSMLPPTSPKRAVRRSMLRMLSAQSPAGAVDAIAEAPPRVARKVIIRHISHSAAPPPLGLLRPERSAPGFAHGELPPETIIDQPTPSLPTTPTPGTPQIAPLNVSIDVRGDWDHEAGVAPMVLVSNVDETSAVSTFVDAHITQPETSARAMDAALEGFLAKSWDDEEQPTVRVRVDAPHAHGRHRPHARFAGAGSRTAALEAEKQVAHELTFAEAPELSAEALASDLIPATGHAAAGNVGKRAVVDSKPAVPVWEVDRFHWPRTCEKLFADENGYLTGAGEKLQAAMQDGLKVLAITGSRRGEGRSTLALCLARAAAKVGIQAALMDADFARPQLASKVGVDVAHGWQEAALGKVPLSEAAVKSVSDNITLLPLESAAATRALSLADPRVTATIRAAAATFELLIMDLGPLGAGGEIAFPIGEKCPFDAAIVVRDLRFATATESEAIGHVLQDAGVEAVGIAENFVIEDENPAPSF